MSLINRMLLDLDRRHAMAGADQAILPRHVRAVEGARAGREWFWRIVAALALAAAGWGHGLFTSISRGRSRRNMRCVRPTKRNRPNQCSRSRRLPQHRRHRPNPPRSRLRSKP